MSGQMSLGMRWHGRCWRGVTLGAVAVGTGLGILALGAGAADAASNPLLPTTTTGWINYKLPSGVDATRTSRRVFHGLHGGDSCEIPLSGTLARGAPAVEMDEVAFNPATCDEVYAVGPVQHPEPGQSGHSSSSGGTLQGDPSTALPNDPAFYMKSFQEDNAGIDVTSLRNDIDWHYNYGGCVTWSYPKWQDTWYWPSGWGENSHSYSPYAACGYAGSRATALMENDLFCPGLFGGYPTYTDYPNYHQAQGDNYGNASWNQDDSKSGGCVSLLSHHVVYGWEATYG